MVSHTFSDRSVVRGIVRLCCGIVLLTVGCESYFEPVDVQKGDRCAKCTMEIHEQRVAGEIMFIGGEAMKFDDIGCLIEFHYGIDSATTHGVFVQDYNEKGWITEEEAYVLLHSDRKTPRGYNTIAFFSRKDAENGKRLHGGKVMSLKEILVRETLSIDSSVTR